MKRHGIADALLVFAQYALLVWMAQATGLLFGGVLKAIAIAAFALLLLFVVRRSANALKTITVCCGTVSASLRPASVNIQYTRIESRLVLPDEPLRASLFQRPPPLYSL